jgi:hypothetical protein
MEVRRCSEGFQNFIAVWSFGQHDFGQGVRNGATFSKHTGKAGRRYGRPASAVHVGSAPLLAIRWPSRSFARAARNASIAQFESCATLRRGGPQRDAFRLIAGNANVAARIYNAASRTVQTQNLDRAVNRISFRNSAQIDPQGPMEKDSALHPDFDITPRPARLAKIPPMLRQKATVDQIGPHRHIEATVGRRRNDQSRAQNLSGPLVDAHRCLGGATIEAADIAIAVVNAHEPMHRRHFGESRIDRPMRLLHAKAAHAHADHGAQQRLRALDSKLNGPML